MATTTLKTRAIYEKGVFRPLERIPLKEDTQVELEISTSPVHPLDDLTDWETIEEMSKLADPSVTLEEVRAITSKFKGSLSDVIQELREDRLGS